MPIRLVVLLAVILGSPVCFAEDKLAPPTTLDGGFILHDQEISIDDETMRVWAYLPADLTRKRIPCVLIAPAGTRLFHGIKLADGDRPEHLPYLHAGYAVIAYEISGSLPDDFDDDQAYAAARRFKKVEGGIRNAKAALDFALKKLPMIDSKQVYAAGHSSAATLALQLTTAERRIKGCIAYAPETNLAEHFGAGLSDFDEEIPKFSKWILALSPDKLARKIKKPTLLFHAEDDSVCSLANTRKLYEALKKLRRKVTLETVKTGGHYDSMISSGIPLGIQWIGKKSGVAPLEPKAPKKDAEE